MRARAAAPMPAAHAVQPALAAGAASARAADLLRLTKPRIGLLVLLCVLAGYALGTRGAPDPVVVGLLCLGTWLVSAGGSALNMWMERDADALMERTRLRPLPAGRIRPQEALWFGAALAAAGLVVLAGGVGPLPFLVALATVGLYLGAYTPLKRRSTLNTVVGAVPGALPPLIGYAAAAGTVLEPAAFVLFAIVFLWQLPHVLSIAWLHREDYARAGFRMLPSVDPTGAATGRQTVLHSVELALVSLLPAVLGLAGPGYLWGALALGAAFTAFGAGLALRRTEAWARAHVVASLAYLPALLVLLLWDRIAVG